MPLLDEAIYNHLSAITDITNIIPATNIQWSDATQETTVNRIIYKLISAPPLYDATDQWQRWEFIIIHTDKWQCLTVANLVRDNLHRFNGNNEGLFGGMNVSYIAMLDDTNPVLQDDDTYSVLQEYRFLFNNES